jgi:SAM-dependent methyltransferase
VELEDYKLMASVEDTHWWNCARREIVEIAIKRYSPRTTDRPWRLLEVGCGSGGNLPTLAQFGNVLGAEHEPLAIDSLRSKFGDRFSVLRHSIPEPLPGPFHVVGMFDVLEHIEDDAAAMKWVADQLKPGGVAIVTVPALPFLWSEHDEAAHHFRRYTRRSLLRTVPSSVEVVHAAYFNFLLLPVVAAVLMAVRLLPKRFRPRGTHMGLPPKFFNRLLYQIFRQERHLAPKFRVPVGVSLLLILRRRSDSGHTSSS